MGRPADEKKSSGGCEGSSAYRFPDERFPPLSEANFQREQH
jgi:hypothetical protein